MNACACALACVCLVRVSRCWMSHIDAAAIGPTMWRMYPRYVVSVRGSFTAEGPSSIPSTITFFLEYTQYLYFFFRVYPVSLLFFRAYPVPLPFFYYTQSRACVAHALLRDSPRGRLHHRAVGNTDRLGRGRPRRPSLPHWRPPS